VPNGYWWKARIAGKIKIMGSGNPRIKFLIKKIAWDKASTEVPNAGTITSTHWVLLATHVTAQRSNPNLKVYWRELEWF